eukprot:scaffold1984_cov162-Amphora_coffeaeformis.AAC.4
MHQQIERFSPSNSWPRSPERTYALLGQSYMTQVFYCQQGDVALALSDSYDGNENIKLVMGRYHQKLVPLVQDFEVFYDLEDDDGGCLGILRVRARLMNLTVARR